MSACENLDRADQAERSAALAYLESRVREEADAAARAASMEATLAQSFWRRRTHAV